MLFVFVLTDQCDAIRPSCGPCRTRNLNCSYDTEPGVTWSVSLKRKHDAMQTDLEQLRQIYEAIRTSPRVEADNIVKQIRDSSNPLEVISCTWNRSTTASNKHLGPLSDAKMRNSAERPGIAGPTTATQACQECRGRFAHDDGLLKQREGSDADHFPVRRNAMS